MFSLQQILAGFVRRQNDYCYNVTEDWLQGRTVFGGLIAALANEAMRGVVGPERPLRALQIVYVGPNSAGEIAFSPAILRAGKAVTLANCIVRSGGEVTATINAMYGGGRESALNVFPNACTLNVAAENLIDVPRRPGFGPSFTQHYQQRWARGAPPFSGADHSDMSVNLRYLDEPVATLTEAHALALMDAIPTPALALLRQPGPASTLSWTLEFVDHRFDFPVDAWWRLDAVVDAAAEGYVVHSGHVVNPEGKVTAISRQVVVVYG
jgi:acyl-CoA thioesterase